MHVMYIYVYMCVYKYEHNLGNGVVSVAASVDALIAK